MDPESQKGKERVKAYNKITLENEKYSIKIKTTTENSIYICIIFENNVNKIFETTKLYEEIKKDQVYFEDYHPDEIYDEIVDLISKDSVELEKKDETIIYNIILPFKKRKTLNFILENSVQNIGYNYFNKILKQKDEIIKQKDEIIKEKNKIIQELNDIISNLKEKITDLTVKKVMNNEPTKPDENQNKNNKENNGKNLNFKDFNIANLTPKNKLKCNSYVYAILQLQDGRLASSSNDGSISIYNKDTFEVELKINEHKESIYDLIQLKNGNIVSCSYYDKKVNIYQLTENNNYNLLSQMDVDYPRKLLELENNEIVLLLQQSIIVYLNINNEFSEDFNIERKQGGEFFDMIITKPEELAFIQFINLGIHGNACEIQFFDLKSRKKKESIDLKRSFNYYPSNIFCMMNERHLCVGGTDKITIIDINKKTIIREIENKHCYYYSLYKLNDNILLAGNDKNLEQWKISQNNLELISEKEKAHQSTIYEIIKFGGLIVTCSYDQSIKIW